MARDPNLPMLSDLNYAFRQFRKIPGFMAMVVLILGLGMGANTAIFTFVDALLLRGLPVSHPEELVLMSQSGVRATLNGGATSQYFSYPDYQQFRDRARSLNGVLVTTMGSDASLIAGGLGRNESVSVQIAGVSGDFFSVLGVPAFQGRTLTPDDDRAGAPQPVVVLSHAFWQRNFGGDLSVLGKTVSINQAPVVVVGIAAPGFLGVIAGHPFDVWAPIQLMPTLKLGSRQQLEGPQAAKSISLFIVGRLRAGVTRKTANAELDVIFQAHLASSGLSADPRARQYFGKIDLLPGGSGYLRSGAGDGRAQIESLLGILMAVVGLVLVVACANVAGLMLVRAAVRQRELALRTALGAGRGRLIRQLMAESLLLTGIGGFLGLLFAHWGVQALAAYIPGGAFFDLRPDGRLLLFVTALSVISGVLIGVVPALKFSRLELMAMLKNQESTVAGGSSQRLNGILVAAQIAFSVCLLAGSGLFVRTLQNLKNVDVGFDRRNLMLVSVPFDRSYNATRRAAVSRNFLAGLEALPGVRGVTFLTGGGGLLSGGASAGPPISVEGYVPRKDEPMDVFSANVGPRFFETFGIALIRGREFEFADAFPAAGNASPAAYETVINESMARKYFSGRDPLGRDIHIPDENIAKLTGVKPVAYRIIGVVKDTKYLSLRDENVPEIFLPDFGWGAGSSPTITFAARTAADPRAMASAIRALFRSVDPKTRAPTLNPMDEVLDRTLSQERMIAQAASSFSLFALLLAALGLYGVLAYNVARRTREIGVRMALGAAARDVVWLIVRRGLALAVLGCAAGIAASAELGHLVSSWLYGVPAVDSLTLVVTMAGLLAAALIACWLPARRATKVDPMVALRAE